MDKLFIMSLMEVDRETGETRELLDEGERGFSKLAIVGLDPEGEHCCEMIFNTNILDIGAMIASSSKIRVAARIANIVNDLKKERISDFEEGLIEIIKDDGEFDEEDENDG